MFFAASSTILSYPILWGDLLRSHAHGHVHAAMEGRNDGQKTQGFVLDFGCLRFWPPRSSPQNPWLPLQVALGLAASLRLRVRMLRT